MQKSLTLALILFFTNKETKADCDPASVQDPGTEAQLRERLAPASSIPLSK